MEYRLCNNTYFSLFFFVSRAYLLRKSVGLLRVGLSCMPFPALGRFAAECSSCGGWANAQKACCIVGGVRSCATIRPDRFMRNFPGGLRFPTGVPLGREALPARQVLPSRSLFPAWDREGAAHKAEYLLRTRKSILILDSAIARSSLTTAESPRRTICSFPFS